MNIKELRLLIENVINEAVFNLDTKDPNLGSKIEKIKGDTSLFDKTKDEIVIDDVQLESYSKKEINAAIDDHMKAIKKADRELEYETYGNGWRNKHKIHKDKKKYDRKSNFDVVEEMTVGQIKNKILENKHNGIVMSGLEFKNKIKQ